MNKEGFEEMAKEFIQLKEVWNAEKNGWQWDWQLCKNGEYLKLEKLFRKTLSDQIVEYEIHIIFEESFRIPNVYIRAFFLDGSLYPCDQMLAEILQNSNKINKNQQHPRIGEEQNEYPTTFSIEEHPFQSSLHQKQYFILLHFCATPDILSSLKKNQECKITHNLLLSWFSVIAPQINLYISPHQWQLFFQFFLSRHTSLSKEAASS
mmetsp:Transcript_6895/g.9655  ORF Transcript_6895/g.9655 Transcript_6895/m.9655 type:complete len:207 (+) Transcript_6895:262-882(+)